MNATIWPGIFEIKGVAKGVTSAVDFLAGRPTPFDRGRVLTCVTPLRGGRQKNFFLMFESNTEVSSDSQKEVVTGTSKRESH